MNPCDPLSALLAERGVLLADGATGTNLFAMGLESGEPPEFWNRAHPERICVLYQAWVDAGSDLFLTNSFGANAARLKLHHAEDEVRPLNRRAAELAREVADRAPRKVLVAGSMGPTGEILEPMGSLSYAAAVEIFHEQADALKEGGVDLLWIETMSAAEEVRAAAEAAHRATMPFAMTMSFDTAGRTMMGVTAADLVRLAEDLPHPPAALGANCGVGAADLLRTILGITAQGPEWPVIAKGNAGIPRYENGAIVYNGTPALMAEYAVLARAAGARIIGGCCGTTPEHLRAMREALDTRPLGERPTLEQVVALLGPLSSASDGLDDGGLCCRPGAHTHRRRSRRAG